MRLILKLLSAVLFCLASLPIQAAHTQVRLVLAAETARPGDTVLAGVHLQMDPGWHTYWKNSGGSGMPTEIEWHLPAGVTAGEIQWPVPEKLPDQELTTYIYSNEVVLLVPLKLAPDLPTGPIELKAKVKWLECEVQCIPGSTTVQAVLNIGPQTKPSKNLALIESWQKRVPKSGDSLSARAWWEKGAKDDLRPFILEWNSAEATSEADFFPYKSEPFEVQPITERIPSDAGKIRLRAQMKKLEGDWPKQIAGVLIQQSGHGRLAYEVNLPVETTKVSSASGTGVIGSSLWKYLLYAFLGGLILNIMPCVLPVIALKILGFVSDAGNAPAQVRKLGLIYAAGVLCSFFVLAIIIVAVGAGWGFQFSSPYFLIAMAILVTLIALNLFGVFEVNLGAGALTTASGLASKHGSAGAFFNGLLTTVLATSCSAPFLAAAIGFASALANPAVRVLFMLTVGIGLAFPYLVLSWQPAWLRFLPKPGPWMQHFKVAMGFPMAAAAVWLCSLVRIFYEDRAWWMAMFLIFVAVAAWIYGEFVQRGSKGRWLAGLFSAALLGVGYAYALEKQMAWREPLSASKPAVAGRSKVAPRGLPWEKWSPEAVAAAQAAGRPVVVDFTAIWCPTCNTIVKPSFESGSVQKKLKEVDALTLVADFSLRPKDIEDELHRFRRDGVPLVLIYPKNPNEPPMVFDLVTPGIVLKALEQAVK